MIREYNNKNYFDLKNGYKFSGIYCQKYSGKGVKSMAMKIPTPFCIHVAETRTLYILKKSTEPVLGCLFKVHEKWVAWDTYN